MNIYVYIYTIVYIEKRFKYSEDLYIMKYLVYFCIKGKWDIM